jgi:hypothetical protein
VDIVVSECSGFHSGAFDADLLGCGAALLHELFLIFQSKEEEFFLDLSTIIDEGTVFH